MKTKYPRSWHLPYSEKPTKGDTKHDRDDHFDNKQVVVSIKMDGENTTIYNDSIHARSLDSKIDSEDRRWVDTLRKSKIEGNIPDGYRICGENLFYRHTCAYDNLDSMFYVFSIWDGDRCLSWDETTMWCGMIGLHHVPVIYEGIYDKDIISDRYKEYVKNNKSVEGYVVRLFDEFNFGDFSKSLSKFVDKRFEVPSNHWRHSKKTLNKLNNDINPWNAI